MVVAHSLWLDLGVISRALSPITGWWWRNVANVGVEEVDLLTVSLHHRHSTNALPGHQLGSPEHL